MADPAQTREEFVKLAPTLSDPLTARYVLLHYGLGEPRMDALAVSACFQDSPLDAEEAAIIAAGWRRDA